MEHQIAKGVFDILPHLPDSEEKWRDSHLWNYVESVAQEIASEFGFHEIRTPLFEKTTLFERGIGEETDIVSKEMYTFLDKGGRSITLRPEGTASVMRAFIENHLDQKAPLHKFYYLFPMFRYERQQAGRYRQHHQFGIEAIGNGSPLQDVEVIYLLHLYLKRLGIEKVTLHLNSIGDQGTREAFKEALKKYLTPHLTELSLDSQKHFVTNPLRILDSKDPKDKKFVKEAPSILDFLDGESKEHFEEVKKGLQDLGVAFHINPLLVRGLDYYNKTVFEITSEELGAQNSLGGGGRYDGLLKGLHGPDLPCIGFGSGIERVIQTMLAQKVYIPKEKSPLLYLIPLEKESLQTCLTLYKQLHEEKLAVQIDFSERKLKAQMRYADTIKARFVAVIGDEERAKKEIVLKEMETKKEEKVGFDKLLLRLKNV